MGLATPQVADSLTRAQAVTGDADHATQTVSRLRLGLQREYAGYISEAKRIDTKRRRIEKILPVITAGMGFNDRYRKTGKRNPDG